MNRTVPLLCQLGDIGHSQRDLGPDGRDLELTDEILIRLYSWCGSSSVAYSRPTRAHHPSSPSNITDPGGIIKSLDARLSLHLIPIIVNKTVQLFA